MSNKIQLNEFLIDKEYDNQSNFGTGYGYQYGSHEGLIEIYMNNKWCVFATEKALASSLLMIETYETETEEQAE